MISSVSSHGGWAPCDILPSARVSPVFGQNDLTISR
jgi:hypothetical protein